MSTAPPLTAPSTRPPRARPARSRRWLRLVIPFLVLGAFWAGTAIAREYQEPDLSDPGTLSPTGTGPDGSSRLAGLLTAGGVRIERVTSTEAGMRAAGTGDATIFVPTPDYLVPRFLDLVDGLPGEYRVVIVKPGLRAFLFQQLPVFESGDRWATGVTTPRCDTSAIGASRLGSVERASLRRATYAPWGLTPGGGSARLTISCYGGAVLGIADGDTEVVVVGATDPFRNERIGDQTNQSLATALLGTHHRVIWLDLHSPEPIPIGQVALPAAQLPEYRRGERDRTATGDPTLDAFPAALWAVLLLGMATAALLALARARRLGGPIAEPLPVLVPAAEAVTGRGRLYQRIHARSATLDALRDAAVRRIARVLNPFGAPALTMDQLVVLVAQRTGESEDFVRAVLAGPSPADDEELAAVVRGIDELVAGVLHDTNPAAAPSPSHPTIAAPRDINRDINEGGPA